MMTPIDVAVLVIIGVGLAIYLKGRKKKAPKKDIPKGTPNPGADDDR